jgi:hypothetical protein
VLSLHFTTVRVDARLLNRWERNRVPYAGGEPLHLSHKRTSRPDSAHRRSVLVLKKEKLAPANGMRRRLRCPLLKRFYCMRTTHLATLFGMLGCRHCQNVTVVGGKGKAPAFTCCPWIVRTDPSACTGNSVPFNNKFVLAQIRCRKRKALTLIGIATIGSWRVSAFTARSATCYGPLGCFFILPRLL